jgi:putative acetyltransferase
MTDLTVHVEARSDRAAIDALHIVSFPGPGEAALVHALRARSELVTSLVADLDGALVGHVAFSPVVVEGSAVRACGLGPVAVAPALRRRGVADALIRAGLDARRAAGDELAVVLGRPAYYARFGFVPAARFGLTDDYGGGDAFQALELRPGSAPAGGATRYASSFALVAARPPAAPPEHLALIAAVGENDAIGRAGALPWFVPEDRTHFERTTRGHSVILGRRTWEETGCPLPGRRNIVVSRSLPRLDGATVVGSLDDALTVARRDDAMPFVLGGARLFREALPRATRLYVTEIPARPEDADTFFHLDRRGFEEVASWEGASRERYVVLGRVS